MWLVNACMGLAVLVYVLLLIVALCERKGRGPIPFHGLYDPMETLLRRTGWFSKMRFALHRQQSALTLLSEGAKKQDDLLRWVAEAAGQGYAALTAFLLLGSLSGNGVLAGIGVLLAVGLPMLRSQELRKRLDRRRNEILLELPELLNRILLLVGAGENVMKALERSAERGKTAKPHPLYLQLSAALAATKRGESTASALEEFGRRCAVAEAKLFATVLLINARRGGETLVPALMDLSRTLWEKRKTVALTIGEQASSRLAFPLAVVFLIILVLAGAPALLLMG